MPDWWIRTVYYWSGGRVYSSRVRDVYSILRRAESYLYKQFTTSQAYKARGGLLVEQAQAIGLFQDLRFNLGVSDTSLYVLPAEVLK